ncbi:hypothetical protein JHU04_003587 [Brenneria sp. 4F2]|nr:hypothetical protein [Brenneria bubanii]
MDQLRRTGPSTGKLLKRDVARIPTAVREQVIQRRGLQLQFMQKTFVCKQALPS